MIEGAFFILVFEPLEKCEILVLISIQGLHLALFFSDEGLLHCVHHLFDMIRLPFFKLGYRMVFPLVGLVELID